MPRTLYLYILRELLRVLLLSAAVLVVVLSFATAIKPLADGLLGPATLVRFVLYTIPTLLPIVLPFAGAFAATLVFTRLANDNEILACLAGGLSYRTILAPVAVVGLILAVSLGALSSFAVPWFLRSAAETIERDVVTAMVAQLDQGRAFEFKPQGMAVYADAAQRVDAPRVTTAAGLVLEQEVELRGVAVGRLDREKGVINPATATSARVQLYREPQTKATWVRIRLVEPMVLESADDEGEGGQVFSISTGQLRPIRLPSPLRDNPKYFSWSELNELAREPANAESIRELIAEMSARLAATKLRRLVTRDLLSAGVVELQGPLEGERYRIIVPAARVEGEEIRIRSEAGLPIVIEAVETFDGRPLVVRRYEALRGTARVTDVGSTLTPGLKVNLERVRVSNPASPGQASEFDLRELDTMTWPDRLFSAEAEEVDRLPFGELVEELRTGAADDPEVGGLRERLESKIRRMEARVVTLKHQRAAAAVSCGLLLPLGAVLAVLLRGQLPLAVFFWSFLLAILTLVIIHASENIATKSAGEGDLPLGLTFLWSGNVISAVVLGTVYCLMARN